jgi:tRNA dimethylallyltransferase
VLVSADAMQVYRGMDIGTAKPDARERSLVQHFGLDLIEPADSFSAAAFLVEAERAFCLGKPVIVVGGTSLYLQALVRGLAPTPEVDPGLRRELAALEDPWEELRAVDPALAARLHPNDRMRVLRGLEVARQTGRRLSDLHAEHASSPDRVEAVCRWVDRDDLDERIALRLAGMVEKGYVNEVERLLASGVPRTVPSMRTLGYRHLCDHLLDRLPLHEALTRTQTDTRRFARKQRTWLNTLRFEPVDGASPGALDTLLRAAEAAFAGAAE